MERDEEWLRAAWRATVAQETDPKGGSSSSWRRWEPTSLLDPLYALSKRGERAYCSTPRSRAKNTTVLMPAWAWRAWGALSLALPGAIDATVFEAYLEQALLYRTFVRDGSW